MKNPHQALIDEINGLTNEQLATKDIWDVIRLVTPRGYADRIGSNLHIGGRPLDGNTIRSWGNDPNVGNVNTAAGPDQWGWGRTSPGDALERYLFSGLYPVFPEGVALFLKWFALRFAQYEAAQGRPEVLNALESNDKARALLEEAAKILRGNPTDST